METRSKAVRAGTWPKVGASSWLAMSSPLTFGTCRVVLLKLGVAKTSTRYRSHGIASGGPLHGDWHYGCLLLSMCTDIPSADEPVGGRQECCQVQRHAQGPQS